MNLNPGHQLKSCLSRSLPSMAEGKKMLVCLHRGAPSQSEDSEPGTVRPIMINIKIINIITLLLLSEQVMDVGSWDSGQGVRGREGGICT